MGKLNIVKECFPYAVRSTFEPPKEYALKHLRPDAFIESPLVLGLEPDVFHQYLRTKDAALVMFYDEEWKHSDIPKKEIAKAATRTNRLNHGYAGINCSEFYDFCCNEEIDKLPTYRVYNWGKLVAEYKGWDWYSYQDIKSWVECVPYGAGNPALTIQPPRPPEWTDESHC